MIRQHFYPKNYFRNRSFSKGNCNIEVLPQQNKQKTNIRQIAGKNIKINKKTPILKENNDREYFIQGIATQCPQTQKNQEQSFKKKKNLSFQQSNHFALNINVLNQCHNRGNKQIRQKIITQSQLQSLFVKSDRKQIIKVNRSSYKIFDRSNSENESFHLDNTNELKPKSYSTYRKPNSADGCKNSFRRSLQRRKKRVIPPEEMIVSSNASTLQKIIELNDIKWRRNSKKQVESKRQILLSGQIESRKQLQSEKQLNFQRLTQNLINLNLSKAIKFRQSSKNDKVRKSRKASQQYIRVGQIQQRNSELQQKVKGWEIQIQDDIDFTT